MTMNLFSSQLKGCPSGQVSVEIENILHTLDLEAKRHAQAKTLSGGMKRKLSVGIALIAGSKVIMIITHIVYIYYCFINIFEK